MIWILISSMGWASLYTLVLIISVERWVVIHEYSHLIAAKLLYNIKQWEMSTVPSKIDGRNVGGYVNYKILSSDINDKKLAIISLAPFVVSTIACIIIPMTITTVPMISIALSGGLLDHVIGTTADEDLFWDMPKAADKLNISLNKMRALSLSILVISLLSTMYMLMSEIISLIK